MNILSSRSSFGVLLKRSIIIRSVYAVVTLLFVCVVVMLAYVSFQSLTLRSGEESRVVGQREFSLNSTQRDKVFAFVEGRNANRAIQEARLGQLRDPF
jgi:hypothetical protein